MRAGSRQQLPLPVEPAELLMLGVLVKQHAIARNREGGLPPAPVANLRDDDHSFAAQFKTPRIELLRHESAIVREQQGRRAPAQNRGICRAGIGAYEHFRAGRIERTGANGRFAWTVTRGEIQKLTAARQKVRESMRNLGARLIQPGGWSGRSTVSRNLAQRADRSWAEQDHSFAAPG